MSRTRLFAAWFLAFAMFFLTSFIFDTYKTNTTPEEPLTSVENEITPASPDLLIPEETAAANPASEDSHGKAPVTKQGLVKENGSLYYYTENGTRFNRGVKEVVIEDSTDYYFFLSNGQAFTSGYKTIELDGIAHYYFFESSGKAFTGGLKDIPFGTQTYTYFFNEDGKAVTSGWVTQNDGSYYFRSNGRAVKDAFVLIDGNRYYFDENGHVATGWFCVDDNYYFADENGVLATNTIIDNYKLDKNGRSHTKYQILKYVNELTDVSMTDQEKIDALYDWVLNNDMVYLRTYEHANADWEWYDGWINDFAASQMENWGGNCYRYSAFLGMLIREATGLEVKVYQGQTPAVDGDLTFHGWPAVNQNGKWYIYDVELQKHSYFSSDLCYKVPATSSSIHLYGEGYNLY